MSKNNNAKKKPATSAPKVHGHTSTSKAPASAPAAAKKKAK